jgi:hypothetical protein
VSLEEQEAFPIDSPKALESPGLPPDLGAGPAALTGEKPVRRLIAIALVVVGVLGAVAAARFFMTAAHTPPAETGSGH